MDAMANANLAASTMRVRQSTLSSFCSWVVKRGAFAPPTPWLDLIVRRAVGSYHGRGGADGAATIPRL